MTAESVDLTAVLGKVLQDAHKDELLAILLTALQQIMNAEANELCNADYRARTDERQNSRNGYRQRPFETRLGGLELQVPKLREGSYLPSFVNPRRRWEKAFVSVVSEAYVLGVSTRKVESLVEAMGAKGISKSEVSRMAAELDTQVQAFRERRLDAVAWPYVWLDALYVKVRENSHMISKAVLVAYGVNEHGEREVLGVDVAASEMELAWKSFLEDLVRRGLRGVKLVISDAHSGLRAAICKVLVGTSWQRCSVHFLRNVLSHLPRKAQGFAAAAVKNIFHQQNPAGRQGSRGRGPGAAGAQLPSRRRGRQRGRGRRAGLHVLPHGALEADQVLQPPRAAQQGDPTQDEPGRHLPQRRRAAAPGDHAARRTER